MTPAENIALIHKILCLTWADGYEDGVFFRPDDDNVTITAHAHLNDVFDWASSDCEAITPENVAEFEQAWKDVKALSKDNNYTMAHDAAVIFACRIRKQRPFKHKDAYPVHASVWPLIEAMPYPVRSP